jgi:molybdopterin/thiamine biosynthesis adenylyltransferase
VKEPEVRIFPVLDAIPGVTAMLQVMKAIKLITGYEGSAVGKLIVFNSYRMEFSEIPVAGDPKYSMCNIITVIKYLLISLTSV